MTKINKNQIREAFVSDPKEIGDVYNNQDWYQADAQRMRYILATGDYLQPPGEQWELGQEKNRFGNCISFEDHGMYKINDEKKLLELILMTEEELSEYITHNEYDWIGDDYDHAMEYLFGIMNHWQDVLEYDTEDYDNIDCMTITTRSREWKVDPDAGYKSENEYEVGYNILMEYFDNLPDDDKESIHKRLEAVGI